MSRRIDQEHRLVYLVSGADIVILQAGTTTAEMSWRHGTRAAGSLRPGEEPAVVGISYA
jgi:YoeB-like toxin of bacterial type II toxin-antitoxin system